MALQMTSILSQPTNWSTDAPSSGNGALEAQTNQVLMSVAPFDSSSKPSQDNVKLSSEWNPDGAKSSPYNHELSRGNLVSTGLNAHCQKRKEVMISEWIQATASSDAVKTDIPSDSVTANGANSVIMEPIINVCSMQCKTINLDYGFIGRARGSTSTKLLSATYFTNGRRVKEKTDHIIKVTYYIYTTTTRVPSK
jgi:hypothetical protein